MSDMAERASTGQGSTRASAIMAFERACDRFEAAWRAGDRPRIEDFLDDPAGGSRTLLRDLLTIELAYRRGRRERPIPEEYEERFPGRREAILEAFAPSTSAASRGGLADRRAGVSNFLAPPPRPDPGSISASPWPASAFWRPPVPTIEGFDVLEEIGRGGMGVVYCARQVCLDRVVALKMILSGVHADSGAIARFRGEALAAARLQHPSIVQIHGIGDHNGHPYIIMEYVEGGSLADTLHGRPWPPRAAARFVGAIAEAIDQAHRVGIVHRDLKPANILLKPDGQPKVTDFGLAKFLDSDRGPTLTDSILGSPSYMAPEQANGHAGEVGPRADVYALGAILYELLTGRPPFKEATILRTLDLVRSADPVAPSRLVPGLPRDAETICLTCLKKEPGRRYSDALALARDLRRFAAEEPIAARPEGAAARALRWIRKRPATGALAILAGVLSLRPLLVLAIGAPIGQREARAEPTPSRLEGPIRERSAPSPLPARIATDREVLPLETRGLPPAPGDPLPVDPGLEFVGPGAPSSLVQPWTDREQVPPTQSLVARGHAAEVWDAALSPDGRLLVSGAVDRTVRLWDPVDGRELRMLSGHKERVYSVAFHPDGHRFVSASADRTAIIWDVRRVEPVLTLRGHTDNVRCALFSPDGRRVATGSWDGTLRIWDAATGLPVRTIPTGAGRITRLAFSPDGSRIALGGTSNVAEIWDHRRGRKLQTYRGHDQHVLSVSFSPDGRYVASTSGNPDGKTGLVKVWEASTAREVLSFRNPAGVLERVAFSPDGRWLATSGWDGLVTLWDARDGRERLSLRGHQGRVWGVNFGPDGNSIVSASADRTVRLWELAPEDEPSPGRSGSQD